MGTQIFWLALPFLVFTFGQNANSLHNVYGNPTREELSVRQGISVTVQYGRDLQVCEMRIHPTTVSLLLKEPETLMMPELVTEIIDELVPVRERGKAGLTYDTASGCNVYSVEKFDHVTISRASRASHNCSPLQPAREYPAIVTFEKLECSNIEKAKLTHTNSELIK